MPETQKVTHPAKYNNKSIPIFAALLSDKKRILDPCAGTGKLALIKQHGFTGKIICNELEPEWIVTSPYPIDEMHIGDAACMSWARNSSFDAICTSPTYGNHKADNYNNKVIPAKKVIYTHSLGRQLNPNNTGRMLWGDEYRGKHLAIYRECKRVLSPCGLFIINLSNHIKRGTLIDVIAWHKIILVKLGFIFLEEIQIIIPPLFLRGQVNLRPAHESILVFKKPTKKQSHKI